MKTEISYRQILRSSSIIGISSVLNILIGLIRTKAVAVMLGPSGVGLIGLFTNIMNTGATIAGIGSGTVGTRQIAAAQEKGDQAELAVARSALLWGTMVLSIVGAVLLWAFRGFVAFSVWGEYSRSNEVGWLGLGVALSVVSASQTALLNGMRRIKELALINILGALLSTVLGLALLWLFASRGMLAFVIAGPLGTFLLGYYFTNRLPKTEPLLTPFRALLVQWQSLLRLGLAFMLAGLAGMLAQLFVRALIHRELGNEAMGHFQASWAISMTYIGFVLGSMGTDFYPRLAGIIHDKVETNRLVNQQTEVALLLSGPVLISMLALAPWVLHILYSGTFAPTVPILRWQVMGDIFKIVSWPLGFILLAAGDWRNFLMVEVLSACIFALISFLGVPFLGLKATGIAFMAMYLFLLPMVYLLAHKRTGFIWNRSIIWHFLVLMIVSIATFTLAYLAPIAGAVLGCLAALSFGVHALGRLSFMTTIGGPVGRLGDLVRTFMQKGRE